MSNSTVLCLIISFTVANFISKSTAGKAQIELETSYNETSRLVSLDLETYVKTCESDAESAQCVAKATKFRPLTELYIDALIDFLPFEIKRQEVRLARYSETREMYALAKRFLDGTEKHPY